VADAHSLRAGAGVGIDHGHQKVVAVWDGTGVPIELPLRTKPPSFPGVDEDLAVVCPTEKGDPRPLPPPRMARTVGNLERLQRLFVIAVPNAPTYDDLAAVAAAHAKFIPVPASGLNVCERALRADSRSYRVQQFRRSAQRVVARRIAVGADS